MSTGPELRVFFISFGEWKNYNLHWL
jgi:hypothetical protein